MKIITTLNGITSIAICAESEIDVLVLKEIARGEVTVQSHDKLQLFDKSLSNVLIITPRQVHKKEDDI